MERTIKFACEVDPLIANFVAFKTIFPKKKKAELRESVEAGQIT